MPLHSTTKAWEDDLRMWPQIMYRSIFSYFIDSVASNGEAINNLKISEYQYLNNNRVEHVLLKQGEYNFVYRKSIRASKSLITTSLG